MGNNRKVFSYISVRLVVLLQNLYRKFTFVCHSFELPTARIGQRDESKPEKDEDILTVFFFNRFLWDIAAKFLATFLFESKYSTFIHFYGFCLPVITPSLLSFFSFFIQWCPFIYIVLTSE